jgi:hypothetical protein
MVVAMNVHKHRLSDNKRILMDARILPLRHTRQAENPLLQFLMKLFWRFHNHSFTLWIQIAHRPAGYAGEMHS